MQINKTRLPGVLLLQPRVFEDHRGEYVELYDEKTLRDQGVSVRFVQDDISVSGKNVLRGIHGDGETWKLISCLLGRIYCVIVICDTGSPDFGQWQSFVLSERNREQLLVPPQHGVAHLALTDRIIFHYKQSTSYNPAGQFTYCWNDPRFKIWWPIAEPILSCRDETGRYV